MKHVGKSVGIALVAAGLVGCGGNGGAEEDCVDPVVVDSTITDDTVWQAQGGGCVDYLVADYVGVEASLEVEPGVIVEFEEEAGLQFLADGELIAEGTSEEPIEFRGTTQSTGWWRGIHLHETQSANNSLDYVDITHGGRAAAANQYDPGFALMLGAPQDSTAENVTASVTNTTLRQSAGYGLFISPNSELTSFSGNTLTENDLGVAVASMQSAGVFDDSNDYSGNGEDFILVSDTVTNAVTLKFPGEGITYRVGNQGSDATSARILVEAALTIEPGVTLEFTEESHMQVESGGSVTAEGTADAPITFTGTAKEVEHWNGLTFYNIDTANSLDHVVVEYGSGGVSQFRALVDIGGGSTFSGSVDITNSEFRHSTTYGIYVYADTTYNSDICDVNAFSDIEGQDCELPN